MGGVAQPEVNQAVPIACSERRVVGRCERATAAAAILTDLLLALVIAPRLLGVMVLDGGEQRVEQINQLGGWLTRKISQGPESFQKQG